MKTSLASTLLILLATATGVDASCCSALDACPADFSQQEGTTTPNPNSATPTTYLNCCEPGKAESFGNNDYCEGTDPPPEEPPMDGDQSGGSGGGGSCCNALDACPAGFPNQEGTFKPDPNSSDITYLVCCEPGPVDLSGFYFYSPAAEESSGGGSDGGGVETTEEEVSNTATVTQDETDSETTTNSGMCSFGNTYIVSAVVGYFVAYVGLMIV